MEIGKYIAKRRCQLKLTMDALAKEIGVSKATIQRWESGEIKNIRHEKIIRIATALKTSPAHLMGWDEKPHTTTLNNIDILNDKGIQRVQSYIDDLILIDKYKKE